MLRIVTALVAVAPVLSVMGAAGTRGPAQASPDPATPAQFTHRQDATGPGDGELTSVSCPAASFCMAVDFNGQAVTYHGTTWSAPVTADAGASFEAVSCASATFCVASSDAQVVTFNGIGWSAPVTVDRGNIINALSCPTRSFCSERMGGATW